MGLIWREIKKGWTVKWILNKKWLKNHEIENNSTKGDGYKIFSTLYDPKRQLLVEKNVGGVRGEYFKVRCFGSRLLNSSDYIADLGRLTYEYTWFLSDCRIYNDK